MTLETRAKEIRADGAGRKPGEQEPRRGPGWLNGPERTAGPLQPGHWLTSPFPEPQVLPLGFGAKAGAQEEEVRRKERAEPESDVPQGKEAEGPLTKASGGPT